MFTTIAIAMNGIRIDVLMIIINRRFNSLLVKIKGIKKITNEEIKIAGIIVFFRPYLSVVLPKRNVTTNIVGNVPNIIIASFIVSSPKDHKKLKMNGLMTETPTRKIVLAKIIL